jgi:hypothetical protein
MPRCLTRSFDNSRTGANLEEAVLTAVRVQRQGVRLVGEIVLPGDARGTEGQVLYVPGLRMRDGLVHDCIFISTMSNDVHCYDAATLLPLWQARIGNPITGNRRMDMYLVNDHWGILGTGAINLDTGTWFVVAMSSPVDDFNRAHFFLHALSLIDGRDQAPPLDLTTASYEVPGLDRVARLGAVARKQRCGLAFDGRNGVDTVFIANGSFLESADTNQGWVVACDVTGLVPSRRMTVAAAWCTTMRYSGGGIWQGGQGLTVDRDGFIYGMTGNGAFDGVTDFGESFFKLRYTPAGAVLRPARLEIVDWFSPFSDTGREGLDPTAPYDLAAARAGGPDAATNMNDAGDQDLNSGGPLDLDREQTGFSIDLIAGAGKDGILYLLNRAAMGRTMPGDFAPDRIAENYARLAAPPYGFTYYPAGIDLAPTDLSTLPTTYAGRTHHQHATPVFYRSPRFGPMLFTGGENGPVRAFRLREPEPGQIAIDYLGCGDVIASERVPDPGGMPGTMMTLSCDGDTPDTAVLWCLNPYDDANKRISPGRLVAYGADWIDGGRLLKLWDSASWGVTFAHAKFNVPTCCGGRLFVPTYDGRVLVFA